MLQGIEGIFFVLLNSSSNNKMKPEEEEEGSAHQDISEKNECSPEKAKGRRTGPCIPPIRYDSSLNFNFRVSRVKLQMGTSTVCLMHMELGKLLKL